MWRETRLFTVGILIFLISAFPVMAAQVTLAINDKHNATANFIEGDADKPALIFIHGFLQTANFSTVKRLADELSESGYAVLLPNLSLGYDFRQVSLPCESIHTHKITDDSNEISLWVDWLEKKTGKPIILIGHSAGSNNIVDYLRTPELSVKKSILISLAYFGARPGAFETEESLLKAQQMLDISDNGLATFSLAFCKEYTTTASAFMSYYQYSREKVIEVLKNTSVPASIIVGGADDRIAIDWARQLAENDLNVQVVDGASHFFDQEHEFDLFDRVIEELAE